MSKLTTTRRAFLGGGALAANALLVACGGGARDTGGDSSGNGGGESFAGTISGSMDMHIQGYDWGAGVDKITLVPDFPFDEVTPESFVVSEHKTTTDWTAEDFPIIEADFPRTVTDATINDDGTVTLDLYCSPIDGSPFLYTIATGYNTWCDPFEMSVALAEDAALTSGGTAITELAFTQGAQVTTAEDQGWTKGGGVFDGIELNYARWDPEEESKNLVVWLHGAGEGGTEDTDPWVTILANKVTALAGNEFQQTVGGAHIVAPQSPTMWMDQGPDADGKPTYITDDATEVASIYTNCLEEFIDTHAESIGGIEKIVLAGCSNGGFMTLWMGLHRPDAYAGIVPICEAIPDGAISDEQIAGIKDLPMYFIWSDDDATVDPATHEIPTTNRLKEAGASNLHIATTEHVEDTSGEFKAKADDPTVLDPEGDVPYQYNGHWSWIYFDNNDCECDEDGMKAWDFIAECMK